MLFRQIYVGTSHLCPFTKLFNERKNDEGSNKEKEAKRIVTDRNRDDTREKQQGERL